MILRDLLNVIDDNQLINICYIDDYSYAATFLTSFIPEEYKDYHINKIASNYFEGSSPFDGSALDIWIDKKREE